MELFDQVFNGEANPTQEERVKAVSGWLRKEYDINVKDQNVLLAMLEVHERGEERQHFGHPEVTSSFGKGIVQLVRFVDGWHIVFRSPQYTEHLVLHPKSETGSYQHPMNRKGVGEVRNLLKAGKLLGVTPAMAEKIERPTAMIDGKNVHIVIPDDKVEDGLDGLPPFPSDRDGFSSESISINLDDYRKSEQ